MLTDLQNSFTVGMRRKCVAKLLLEIPPHLICRYTTLWNVRYHLEVGDNTGQLRDQRWSSLTCGPQTAWT